jgi:hypothetical protein
MMEFQHQCNEKEKKKEIESKKDKKNHGNKIFFNSKSLKGILIWRKYNLMRSCQLFPLLLDIGAGKIMMKAETKLSWIVLDS